MEFTARLTGPKGLSTNESPDDNVIPAPLACEACKRDQAGTQVSHCLLGRAGVQKLGPRYWMGRPISLGVSRAVGRAISVHGSRPLPASVLRTLAAPG